MFPAAVITFRETLEAALVVSILLSYLAKTNQLSFRKFVWQGVVLGVGISALFAFLLDKAFGGIPRGRPEQLTEGTLMLITATFLTWMILWVHRQKEQVQKLKEKLTKHIEKQFGMGIIVLTMLTILREGIETVLYLKATSMGGANNELRGAIMGVLIALVTSWAIFKWTLHARLKTIFLVTGYVLLLFAAGLVSHSVHEFQEAGVLPLFGIDPIFNISHILSEDSFLGSILKALFGYTSKPSILQFIFYGSYVVFILWLEKFTDRMITAKNHKSMR